MSYNINEETLDLVYKSVGNIANTMNNMRLYSPIDSLYIPECRRKIPILCPIHSKECKTHGPWSLTLIEYITIVRNIGFYFDFCCSNCLNYISVDDATSVHMITTMQGYQYLVFSKE